MHSPYHMRSEPFSSEDEFEFAFEPESESEFEFDFEDAVGGGCEKVLVLEGFEPGEYRLQPHHYQPLREFVEQLKSSPPGADKELALVGFGDDPAGGEASRGLGLHRALEVRRFLLPVLEQSGIGLKVVAKSEGDQEQPPAGETDSPPAQGGRVELLLCPIAADAPAPGEPADGTGGALPPGEPAEPPVAEPPEPAPAEPVEPPPTGVYAPSLISRPVRRFPRWWSRRRRLFRRRPVSPVRRFSRLRNFQRALARRRALRRRFTRLGRPTSPLRRRMLARGRSGLASARRRSALFRRRGTGGLRRRGALLAQRRLSGSGRGSLASQRRGSTPFRRSSSMLRRRGGTSFRRPSSGLRARPGRLPRRPALRRELGEELVFQP